MSLLTSELAAMAEAHLMKARLYRDRARQTVVAVNRRIFRAEMRSHARRAIGGLRLAGKLRVNCAH